MLLVAPILRQHFPVPRNKAACGINAAVAEHASELASLDAALRAAADRLANAKAAEARSEDKQRAAALRREFEKFREHGYQFDAALAKLETQGREPPLG
jgi:hypothetical protein